jgi:hypothetical protein
MGGVPDAVAEPAGREELTGKAITARTAISWSAEATSEPARLAAPTTPRPASGMPLRPRWSDGLRATSTSAATARLSVSTTHRRSLVVALSWRTRVGSATFTMVTSRVTISAASHRPTPPDTAPAAGSVDRQAEDTARHNESLIKLSHRG